MKQYRVFIAEDDFRVASIWREFADSASGFLVCGEARTGEEALNHIKQNRVDLLVMDIYMPDMDGLRLLYEIRKTTKPVDVIAITAAKEAGIVQRCLRMGVIDYIVKPCNMERFQLALNRFKDFRNCFQKAEVDQSLIDRIIHGVGQVQADESEPLPKGIQEITLKRILECFENDDFSRSADEISKTTGLSSATVQRYLKYLTSHSLIQMELTYGSQGRPEHKYSKL